MPGLHRQRLPAAQPAPEEVGGEHGADEELESVPAPAGRCVLGAADEEEDPGGEEGDGEEQDRLVRHGSEPPGQPGRAPFTSYDAAPGRFLRARAAAATGIRPTGRAACRASPAAP